MPSSMDDPSIVILCESDAREVACMLSRQRSAYLDYFHPFDFDERTIGSLLKAAQKDRFWGIRIDGDLVGFFMLRGFDEGYTRPSFGVIVAEESSGKGLARLALATALDWCAKQSIPSVMLKVSDENTRARRIYVCAGFRSVGRCPRTNQEVLERKLDD